MDWNDFTVFVNFVDFALTAFKEQYSYVKLFNKVVLMNVRIRTKNSLAQWRTLNSNFTKTISLILSDMLISFIPLTMHLNIIKYVFRNGTTLHSIIRVLKYLRWTMMPSQLNAVLNSIIYLKRSRSMKRYHYYFLNCKNNKEWKWKTLESLANPTKRLLRFHFM